MSNFAKECNLVSFFWKNIVDIVIVQKILHSVCVQYVLEILRTPCNISRPRLKYTEVQSQQMAFTQSPPESNNPKIPTDYLIFAVKDHS